MTNLLIHDVDKTLRARLQAEAERHGRSIDEHARILLAAALGIEPSSAADDGIEHIELIVDDGPLPSQRHREHTRVEYGDIRARFSSDASTKRFGLFRRYFPCEIVDISVRGARIRTDHMLREGESITLYFQHQGRERIVIPARIVRVTSSAGARCDCGVQFRDLMSKGDLRAIICRKVIAQKCS